MENRDLTQFFLSQLQVKDEQLASFSSQVTELSELVKELTRQISDLTKILYGAKSERRPKSKEPLAAEAIPDINVSDDRQQAGEAMEKPKRAKPQKRTYEWLEEKVIEMEPVEDTSRARFLRYEDTVRYSYIAPKVVRTIYRRKIYGNGDAIFMAQLPSYLIDRCSADSSFLAAITVNKFRYHIPIDRQRAMFKSIGIDWSKSTLNDWVAKTINTLDPVIMEIEKQVMKESYLNIDETTVPVLIKNEKKTKKGYMWGIVSEKARLMFFKYDQGSRSKSVMEDLLEDYYGTIQSDAYSAYKNLEKGKYRKQLKRLSCMAHIRRKFIETEATDNRARVGIDFISSLYNVERKCFDPELSSENRMSPQEVKEYRLKHSVPIMKEFYRWLQICSRDMTILPKSGFGKAINYALSEFPGQVKILASGEFRIDNNAAERMMRDPVLGRKNYLFCGEHVGAQRAAKIYSLIGSCKMCNIDPYQYMDDLLRRFQDHNHLKLDELLPNKWKPLENPEYLDR
jgi:transposase